MKINVLFVMPGDETVLGVDIFFFINIILAILILLKADKMNGIDFPDISPIIFSIGPVAIRWYSMAYLFGIAAGWFLIRRNVKKYDLGLSKTDIEDLIFYLTLGVVLGGRLGYVLFYGRGAFWDNPLTVFEVWKGGMSFHGGVIGVITATYWFAKKINYQFLRLTDLVVLYAPIGIFCGRIANFINDELWGRITDVAWAVKFPNGGYWPRHPSQLYEAFFEGIVMFAVLNILWQYKWVRDRSGFVSGLFVLLYGVFRMMLEQFREPDVQMGFFFDYFTMGQILSLPLVILGAAVMYAVSRHKREAV